MARLFAVRLLVAGASLAHAQNSTPAQNLTPAETPGQFDAGQRFRWFAKASFGPASQATSVITAGIDTARNDPPEYGPHWEGFGQRYGIRSAERVISNGFEAGVGAFWGEDPRYFRVPEKHIGGRIKNVIKMVAVSHDSSGHEMPAYARFVAVPSTAFLANEWRPDSANSTGDAVNRILTSFSTRILANAIKEFWPDLKQRTIRRHGSSAPAQPVPATNVR